MHVVWLSFIDFSLVFFLILSWLSDFNDWVFYSWQCLVPYFCPMHMCKGKAIGFVCCLLSVCRHHKNHQISTPEHLSKINKSKLAKTHLDVFRIVQHSSQVSQMVCFHYSHANWPCPLQAKWSFLLMCTIRPGRDHQMYNTAALKSSPCRGPWYQYDWMQHGCKACVGYVLYRALVPADIHLAHLKAFSTNRAQLCSVRHENDSWQTCKLQQRGSLQSQFCDDIVRPENATSCSK